MGPFVANQLKLDPLHRLNPATVDPDVSDTVIRPESRVQIKQLKYRSRKRSLKPPISEQSLHRQLLPILLPELRRIIPSTSAQTALMGCFWFLQYLGHTIVWDPISERQNKVFFFGRKHEVKSETSSSSFYSGATGNRKSGGDSRHLGASFAVVFESINVLQNFPETMAVLLKIVFFII